jgi:hypothetical protein
MYLNTDDHIDVSSLNIPKIELDQQIFLVNNPIDAIKQNLVTSDRKQIVIEAPTGSGKSFTIINYTMLELAKQFANWKVFFFVAPSQENVDEPLAAAKQLDETYLGTRQIRVYDSNQFNEMHKNKSRPAGDINFFFVTTQFMYDKYEEFDHKKPNVLKLIVPNIIINDEAHRGLGVPDAETTKQDTGITNNNWDPKWFHMMEQFLLAGSEIMHMTGTPTDSQKMKTSIGATKYFTLPAMPKYREKSIFTRFIYKGTDIDAEYTLQVALKEYKNQVEIVKVLQDKISTDTWNIMAPSITKTMPAMILTLGRNNAINGVPYETAISKIEKFCKSNKFDLFVSTSKHKSFTNGTTWNSHKLKRMFDGVKHVNSPAFVNRPLVMVVIESGKMGINIPRLTTAAICKVPANKLVHNNHSQFIARTCRMPFFRSHDLAIDFIKNLNVLAKDKVDIIDYYTMLNTTFAILPDNTQLMPLVEVFYSQNTFTMQEGRQYLIDGVLQRAKLPVGSYSVSYSQNELNSLFRKSYCEACETCVELAVSGYSKLYGRPTNLKHFNKYMDAWHKCLNVDHKDGNRYNNHPDNLITVCPNVHMLKTQLQEDYLNNYNFSKITYDSVEI